MQATILSRTPLAVTETHHYKYGQYTIWPKVYFQDSQGRIRSVDGNIGGASSVVADKANLNNGFAALSWGGPETAVRPEERVYYTNDDGQIFELCWNYERGWYPGELNGQYKAAPYSTLAAAAYSLSNWDPAHHIQLYFQDPETDEISELYKHGGCQWVRGDNHQAGIKGTNIAAVAMTGGTQLWYQLPNTKFVQYQFESGQPWKKGNFIATVQHDPCASISATSPYRVFTVSKDNKLALTVCDPDTGKWGASTELLAQIPNAPVAAIGHPKQRDSMAVETIYTQTKPGEITRARIDQNGKLDDCVLSITL